jgi:putative component of membrane protein insertase Oxa1/YidC/SpoIIIJ protein YidD
MGFKTLWLACLLFGTSSLFALRAGYFEPWGKDENLRGSPTRTKNPYAHLYDTPPNRSPLVYGMDLLVQFHQNVISPVDGPRSNFRPTSARYMLLAMKRHGFIKGYLMGCDRLIRENSDPWVYRKKEIAGVVYKWDPTYRSY